MKAKSTDLITMQAFSNLTRLSRKALRLYDSMGLLVPEHVDPQSGYRHYHPDQADTARLIALLRQLDMPLTRIQEVLDVPEHQKSSLVRRYWKGVEQETHTRKRLVEYVSNVLDHKEMPMHEVKTRQIPDQIVATIQRRVFAKDIGEFNGNSLGALFSHLGDQVSGAPFIIFHGAVNEDSDGPVEVCIPFSGQVQPAGDIGIRIEAAHEEAYVTITKEQCIFPEILQAYDAVSSWIKAEGKDCSFSSPREVYFADFMNAGPDDLVCDIAYPIR
ncbi:MerR family transcriptional regulator [Deinococcus roseus]|uniref:MerR family transcriptional regulator n=1 Tax=Deinococcus roseus TaxID=392414 RepID=A0ABQ2D2R9_9DEIO|nr:MerR family transcriptional regulator [Deinococcus roseus]GGJ43646.1 MerR family transcriptional regulator [Deinococcus roseus]